MTKQQQEERFSTWLQEHSRILHHVANGFASGHDRHDLMQELLLALWKALPAFRAEARASTFVYRVSHNAALMWKRGRVSYRRKVEAYEAEIPSGDATVAVPPDKDMLEQVYAGIRELAPLERSLILLSLDGVAYREMAEIHGLTETNVGARLTRAKRKLAESLKGLRYELR